MPKLENFNNRVVIDGYRFTKNELRPIDEEGDNVSVFYTGLTGTSRTQVNKLKSIPYFEWTDSSDTPYASKAALLSDMDTFFFSLGENGGGQFEFAQFKLTYYEIIDISSATSGSLQETPASATIQEGEFGESGNSVLSTLNSENKPSFTSPLDGGGDAITANLDTNGNWVASDTYIDPVALIYSFIIDGGDWSEVSLDAQADFYDANPNTLQETTDKGNTTTTPIIFENNTAGIILKDENGDPVGYVAGDDQFGVNLIGTTDGLNLDRPITLGGNNVLVAGNQIAFQFEGAEEYDVLRILQPVEINGRTVFPLSPFALDYILYSEEAAPVLVDIPLTTTFQNLIQDTTENTYTDGSSQAVYGFEVFNNENQDIVLEYSITQNDSVPSEIFTRTLPAKQSFTVVAGSDSITGGDVSAGSTVEIQARITVAGAVTVVGSQTPITLRLEQNSNTANAIQSIDTVSINGSVLQLSAFNEILVGTTFDLPLISSSFDPDREQLIVINNRTGNNITINSDALDTIYSPIGNAETSFVMKDGETYTLATVEPNKWAITSNNRELTPPTEITQLGTSSTNANWLFNPQTLLTQIINLPYNDAKLTFSFESSNTATNRRTIVGLYINGALADNLSEIEPKDTNNNYYQSKVGTYNFPDGNNTIEVRYGRSGGGGDLAEVSNVRILIEEIRL